jgi:hypothetical protein
MNKKNYIYFDSLLQINKINNINNSIFLLNLTENKFFFSQVVNDRVNINKTKENIIFFENYKNKIDINKINAIYIENYYLLFGEYANNFFHNFLSEVGFHISNISRLKEKIPNLKILIITHTKNSMTNFIKSFILLSSNFSKEDIIELNYNDDTFIKRIFHHFYCNNYSENSIKTYLVNDFCINKKQKKNNILFSCRMNLTNDTRICTNKCETENLLKTNFQFEKVYFENIESFSEQIKIINDYSYFMIEMGSGLSNLYFCSDMIVIVIGSITNKGWYDSWFKLSKKFLILKNIKIYTLWGETLDYDNNSNIPKDDYNFRIQKPYKINILELEKILKNIII